MPTDSDPTEVEGLLSPYFPNFWRAVRKGFARYHEVNREELDSIHDRTKASYINDLIVKYLKELIPDAKWQSPRGQRRFWIGGAACLRVKKVNRNLQPANLLTGSQLAFYDGLISLQGEFENMPRVTPLFLGFTMNRTKSAPERLYIICPRGAFNSRQTTRLEMAHPRILWAIPVPDAEQGFPMVRPPVAPTPITPQTRRVRSKRNSPAPKNTRKED